jgi:hypothetical protein
MWDVVELEFCLFANQLDSKINVLLILIGYKCLIGGSGGALWKSWVGGHFSHCSFLWFYWV